MYMHTLSDSHSLIHTHTHTHTNRPKSRHIHMYTGTHTHTLSKYTLTDQIPDTLNMYPHTRIHSQACLYKKCDNRRENNNGVRGRPHNSPNMFPILLCVCETRVETTHCPPLSSHSVFSACANSASSKHTPIHNTPIEQQRDTHAHTHTHTHIHKSVHLGSPRENGGVVSVAVATVSTLCTQTTSCSSGRPSQSDG